MKCTACGFLELSSDAHSCANCGVQLTSLSEIDLSPLTNNAPFAHNQAVTEKNCQVDVKQDVRQVRDSSEVTGAKFYYNIQYPCQTVPTRHHTESADELAIHMALNTGISYERLKELFTILAQIAISEDDMKESYRASLPPGFSAYNENLTLWLALKHLCDIPVKISPILDFVKRIADKIRIKDIREKLINWIHQVVSELGYDYSEITEDNQISDPIHLLVQLISDPDNRNNKTHEFTVRISAWNKSGNVPRGCAYGNCEKDDIPGKIDEFIENKLSGYYDIHTIEFFLPCEHLYLNVDEWKRKDIFDVETKLVEEFCVITRIDRDRLKGRKTKALEKYKNKWIKQWETFQEQAGTIPDECILWGCDHKTYNPKNLSREFNFSDNAVCLMMTFLPQDTESITGLGHAIIRFRDTCGAVGQKTHQ